MRFLKKFFLLVCRNFLHTIADCENEEAEADEGHYGLWLLTVSSKSIESLCHWTSLVQIRRNDWCICINWRIVCCSSNERWARSKRCKRKMRHWERIYRKWRMKFISSRKKSPRIANKSTWYVRIRLNQLNANFFQYKSEIKKQTAIKSDTSKQLEKVQADLQRTQASALALEKTDVRARPSIFFFTFPLIFRTSWTARWKVWKCGRNYWRVNWWFRLWTIFCVKMEIIWEKTPK